MPYCPECRSEFEKHITRCSRCEADLVEVLEEETEEDINLALLCNVLSEAEAYLIKGLLEGEGIRVFIRPMEVVMYEGVYASSDGLWGTLFVLPEELEKAENTIRDYLEGKLEDEKFFEDTGGEELSYEEDEEEEEA